MSTSSLTRVKFKGSLELVVAVFEEKLPLKKKKNAKEKRHQQLHKYISKKKRNVEHVKIITGKPPSVSRRWDVTDRPESGCEEDAVKRDGLRRRGRTADRPSET